MSLARLEHVNVTVRDARATAKKLCDLFEWTVRWEGPSLDGRGYSVHVGSQNHYLAVYSPAAEQLTDANNNYTQLSGLNHIGVVVDDIDAMESAVKAAGYQPSNHGDYEPGRRFYFDTEDDIEIEIVSYPAP